MADNKWLFTNKVYDEYEKRVAKARLEKEFRNVQEKKEEIINETKKVLSYKEELIPKIKNMEEVRRDTYDGFDAIQLRYETWENFYGCGTLFMPHCDKKVPLVFVLCGHGDKGRLTDGFIKMACHLVKNNVAVFVPDNIGQGDRQDADKKNHTYCYEPFYLGLSLQGLIVMETVALIRYFKNHPKIDDKKIGSCGNSGGGTLNLFLAALAPEISAIAPSGYPCEFSYILSKERRHCACNILPGVLKGPEMWEVLSVFAPKPMLISQGRYDDLIPIDLGQKNARKVENVYVELGKRENFKFARTDTKHSWEKEDIEVISDFLFDALGVEKRIEFKDIEVGSFTDLWHIDVIGKSISTKEMCENITGKKVPENIRLCDIFVPKYNGQEIYESMIEKDLGRGDVMHVLAQFESMF